MIDNLFLDIVHILFPFLIYLFYIAYRNFEDTRENDLLILITIFSSLYISFRFNKPLFNDIPMILINIPLIISFYKKSIISIFISSFSNIYYYYLFFNDYLILFIIEYLIYFIMYLLLRNKINFNIFIIIFSILKLICLGIALNFTLKIVIVCIIFCIISLIIIFLLDKAYDILKINMLSKEIEHDKQIRTSLFQITHEIKNPIAVCKGYLDMFDPNNQNHAKKYIPIMKEEIENVLILLDDFLSMNKLKLNKDIMDINILLEELINNYSLIFKEKGIKVKLTTIDDEIYIDGDYNRLTQVFVNIIKNSIEALNKNPTINIWEEIKENKIYIYFQDNGIGISASMMEKIKEPFFTTKVNGNGLGVALSDEIIRGHNGELIYESKEKEYTLVTVVLPIKKIPI